MHVTFQNLPLCHRRPFVLLSFLAAFVAAFCAPAQDDIDSSRRNAIVRSIERVAPAVVSVNVVQVEAQRILDPLSRDFWDLFDAPRSRVLLRERQMKSVGSGFFFDNKGHILTNYHVIADADRVASVTIPDGRTVEVDVVGGDERTDIAVLKAKDVNLPMVPLGDSNDLLLGEWVIAIGNPFGTLIEDPNPSVSVGVVSANHRRVSRNIAEGEKLYQDMIQTDAAINPGNSGGPLVNSRGEVVGVNTMIFSPSGGSVGLGFAIPINRVKRIAEEIIQYGRRRDPWIGFKVEDIGSIREDFLQELGITARSGCMIVNILTNCPAYEAGLRPGDIIVSINGENVSVSTDIDFVVWSLFVGDTVKLESERAGKRQTIEFPVAELSK